jgi:hypothetical protein
VATAILVTFAGDTPPATTLGERTRPRVPQDGFAEANVGASAPSPKQSPRIPFPGKFVIARARSPTLEASVLPNPTIRVLENPLREEAQEGDRYRFWGAVEEFPGRFLRVVTLSDKITIHNAFLDRRFRP